MADRPAAYRSSGGKFLEYRRQTKTCSKENQRAAMSRVGRESKDFWELRSPLSCCGTSHKLLSIAISVTEGACLFLILTLVGLRASEALALDFDCLEESTLPDGAGPLMFCFFRFARDPEDAIPDGFERKWTEIDRFHEVSSKNWQIAGLILILGMQIMDA